MFTKFNTLVRPTARSIVSWSFPLTRIDNTILEKNSPFGMAWKNATTHICQSALLDIIQVVKKPVPELSPNSAFTFEFRDKDDFKGIDRLIESNPTLFAKRRVKDVGYTTSVLLDVYDALYVGQYDYVCINFKGDVLVLYKNMDRNVGVYLNIDTDAYQQRMETITKEQDKQYWRFMYIMGIGFATIYLCTATQCAYALLHK